VVDEDGPIKQFGFAYGTPTEHAESGEERFTVEWNVAEGGVWVRHPSLATSPSPQDVGENEVSIVPVASEEIRGGFKVLDASCLRATDL
jgi:hypothetical protein